MEKYAIAASIDPLYQRSAPRYLWNLAHTASIAARNESSRAAASSFSWETSPSIRTGLWREASHAS